MLFKLLDNDYNKKFIKYISVCITDPFKQSYEAIVTDLLNKEPQLFKNIKNINWNNYSFSTVPLQIDCFLGPANTGRNDVWYVMSPRFSLLEVLSERRQKEIDENICNVTSNYYYSSMGAINTTSVPVTATNGINYTYTYTTAPFNVTANIPINWRVTRE